MDRFVYKGKKKLRCGYTTGSCAAAAAQRATALLLGADSAEEEPVSLVVPKGVSLKIPVYHQEKESDWAVCAVKKDSGDDPDITNGILVYVKVMKASDEDDSSPENTEKPSVYLRGGLGIGVVTKPGLSCAVGEAAINPVPRRMIEEEVKAVCKEREYEGSLVVEISIPQGIEIAKRTYNPRLGIQGGISVLGTSGIVEPMSEQALVDTVKLEMDMKKANGYEYLVLTPGNYGEEFLKTRTKIRGDALVKCSNFIGEALDHVEDVGFRGVLLVGHLGKLSKVAAGAMNTHSKHGDLRLEVLGVHAGLAGGGSDTLRQIMDSATTEEAIAVLDRSGIRQQTMESLLEKLDFHIKERTHHTLTVGAVLFSNHYGYLGETREASRLLACLEKEESERQDEKKEQVKESE